MCRFITFLSKVKGGFEYVARFSASISYKHVQRETINGCNFFTHSFATCNKYTSEILVDDPPPFTKGFKNRLKRLSQLEWERMKVEEKNEYIDFIDTYGVHFIQIANMGAMYGQRSQISKASWAKLLDKDINIKAAARYSGMYSCCQGSLLSVR